MYVVPPQNQVANGYHYGVSGGSTGTYSNVMPTGSVAVTFTPSGSMTSGTLALTGGTNQLNQWPNPTSGTLVSGSNPFPNSVLNTAGTANWGGTVYSPAWQESCGTIVSIISHVGGNSTFTFTPSGAIVAGSYIVNLTGSRFGLTPTISSVTGNTASATSYPPQAGDVFASPAVIQSALAFGPSGQYTGSDIGAAFNTNLSGSQSLIKS